MIDKLKKRFGFPYSSELENEFRAYIVKIRYKPLLLVVFGIAIFMCILLGWFFFFPDMIAPPEFLPLLSLMHIVFFLFTLIILAIAVLLRTQLLKYPRMYFGIIFIYGIGIFIWSSTVAAYTTYSNVLHSALGYVSLCLAIAMVLKPWQAFLFFTLDLVYFIFLTVFVWPVQGALVETIANSGLVVLISIIIASVFYKSLVTEFYDKITINKQLEQINTVNDQLRERVYIDGLTGVRNRRFFDEILPANLFEYSQTDKQVIAMMFDIDNFKDYNDYYGHLLGDECLQRVTQIVEEVLVDKEAFFVRYGGEEFFVFAAFSSQEDALQCAEDIRMAVEDAAIEHVAVPRGHVTISVGTTFAQKGSDDLITLAHRADKAVYEAKAAGRNTVVNL